MNSKSIQWINTPVITEALIRYKEGLLNRSMKLWIEEVLEINPKDNHSEVLSNLSHY